VSLLYRGRRYLRGSILRIRRGRNRAKIRRDWGFEFGN
jgi:hypothetical protein